MKTNRNPPHWKFHQTTTKNSHFWQFFPHICNLQENSLWKLSSFNGIWFSKLGKKNNEFFHFKEGQVCKISDTSTFQRIYIFHGMFVCDKKYLRFYWVATIASFTRRKRRRLMYGQAYGGVDVYEYTFLQIIITQNWFFMKRHIEGIGPMRGRKGQWSSTELVVTWAPFYSDPHPFKSNGCHCQPRPLHISYRVWSIVVLWCLREREGEL